MGSLITWKNTNKCSSDLESASSDVVIDDFIKNKASTKKVNIDEI